MSEFGVRKVLLIKKVPTQEDGRALKLPQIRLKRAQNSGFFCQRKEEWARQKVWDT